MVQDYLSSLDNHIIVIGTRDYEINSRTLSRQRARNKSDKLMNARFCSEKELYLELRHILFCLSMIYFLGNNVPCVSH
jgi:hypothetical protein